MQKLLTSLSDSQTDAILACFFFTFYQRAREQKIQGKTIEFSKNSSGCKIVCKKAGKKDLVLFECTNPELAVSLKSVVTVCLDYPESSHKGRISRYLQVNRPIVKNLLAGCIEEHKVSIFPLPWTVSKNQIRCAKNRLVVKLPENADDTILGKIIELKEAEALQEATA